MSARWNALQESQGLPGTQVSLGSAQESPTRDSGVLSRRHNGRTLGYEKNPGQNPPTRLLAENVFGYHKVRFFHPDVSSRPADVRPGGVAPLETPATTECVGAPKGRQKRATVTRSFLMPWTRYRVKVPKYRLQEASTEWCHHDKTTF